MPLLPFEPFQQAEQWRRELDKLFSTTFPAGYGFQQEFGTPRMDVYETENEVVAHCDIAGLEKKEDVDIQVDRGVLTISGNITKASEIKNEQMHRSERYTGRFHRSISLPAEVQAEGTTATYRNGILEVRMPKQTQSARKSIDVQFH
jgi:HSP20 family protein